MLTVIFLFAGVLVVVGAVILTLRDGAVGGRHRQSGAAAVEAQQMGKSSADRARAVGEDD